MNMDADASSPRSKRSFAQVASATLFCLHRSRCNSGASVLVSAIHHDCCDSERLSSPSPFKRRSIRNSTMPIQTSVPSHPDSFPSFMSVFGGISSRLPDKEKDKDHHLQSAAPLHPLRVPTHGSAHPSSSRRPLPFQHRESVSSVTSGSSDSSPTTTASTFDSPSAPDTSPSSSPESPSSMPLSYPNFKSTPRNGESQPPPAMMNQPQSQSQSQSQPQPQQHQEGPSNPSTDTPNPSNQESPLRRARNLKNLSLRMPPSLDPRPPIATASLVETTSQHHLSAPPSPIMPPKTNRRKPANLSIRTPGFDKSFPSNITEVVPPTPTSRQSLRHTESSPSLHSVFSPSFGPQGGMQLPRPMTQHGAPGRRSSEGCFSPLPTVADEGSRGGVLHDLEEEDDHLDSRESSHRNERGYPNGPVRIYDSGVYLYLEPTAQEASQFDVVVNVAKEVANPFNNDGDTTVMSAWRNNMNQQQTQESPQTALSETSFKSALEYPSSASQTTALGDRSRSGPEYIHIAWDHNSEILDDLYPLCELIDSHISQGKKVLIHCQLGASRSASLVIAYGLYKNRDLDFNSMYEIVKERSRWVGPNMSLIYQLTDFRSRLVRGTLSKPTPEEWSMGGTTPKSITTPSVPSTATSPSALDTSHSNPQLSSDNTATSLSPPSPPKNTEATLAPSGPGFSKTLSHKRSLPPRPLPLRQMYHTAEPADRPQRPRTSYVQPTGKKDNNTTFARDRPEGLPSLFSPRTTEFLAAPLARPMGSLANLSDQAPSASAFGFGSQIADPRSPPPGNERFIMRSIDEFL